jgi:hypothetical protein
MEVLQIVFGNRRGWRSKNGDAEDNINMDTWQATEFVNYNKLQTRS